MNKLKLMLTTVEPVAEALVFYDSRFSTHQTVFMFGRDLRLERSRSSEGFGSSTNMAASGGAGPDPNMNMHRASLDGLLPMMSDAAMADEGVVSGDADSSSSAERGYGTEAARQQLPLMRARALLELVQLMQGLAERYGVVCFAFVCRYIDIAALPDTDTACFLM